MIKNLQTLLAHMAPVLNPGTYVFVTVPLDHAVDLRRAVATVREAEGLSLILSEEDARSLGLDLSYLAAWITLNVYSDLAAVGLTATVASALAKENISCNVVAGTQHDHLFVGQDDAQKALNTLQALQSAAAAPNSLEDITP